MNSIKKIAPILIVLAAILWGLDGVWRRYLYEPAIPAIVVVFYEHLLGSLVLLPFIWGVFMREKLSKQEWLAMGAVSLLSGVLGTLWFTKALFMVNFIPFSVVLLLQKLQPVFAVSAGAILLRERVSGRFLSWALLAIGAAYFVTFPTCFQSFTGSLDESVSFPDCLVNFAQTPSEANAALLAIGAAFAWGTGTALSRYALRDHSITLITGLRFWITSILALGFVYASGQHTQLLSPTPLQMQYILLISLSTGMVALWIYYQGLKFVQAKISTILELAFPVTGVFIEVYLFQTVLHWSQYVFAVVLLFAMWNVMRTTEQKDKKTKKQNTRKLAFFDVDNTVFDGYLTSGKHSFLQYVVDKKKVPHWKEIEKESKDLQKRDKSGEFSDFEMATNVMELTGKMVKGMKPEEAKDIADAFVEERGRIFDWVESVMKYLRSEGFEIYMVSGANHIAVEAVGRKLEVSKVFASEIVIEKGMYSDAVKEILSHDKKRELLDDLIDEDNDFTVAFGDAEGDVEMLKRVDVGFLFSPRDKKMLALAKKFGWHVGDKDTMYELVKKKVEAPKMASGNSDGIATP